MFRRARLVNLVLLLVVVASAGRAELPLVPDRLVLDALIWGNVHWWRWGASRPCEQRARLRACGSACWPDRAPESNRLSSDKRQRQHPPAPGLVRRPALAQWNRIACRPVPSAARHGRDDRARPAKDGGQFVPCWVHQARRDSRHRSDGKLQRNVFSFAAAVVNGAGENTGDNNNRKDLCGRIAVGPLRGVGLTLAVHGYYGRPDPAQGTWQALGAEAAIERGRFYAQAEFQDQRYSDTRSDDGYVLFSYSTGLVESCVRIESVMLNGQKPDLTLTGGVNVRPVGDDVKVMLNCFSRRDYQNNSTVYGFVLRLQAEL